LPKDETTPPVMKMYRAMYGLPRDCWAFSGQILTKNAHSQWPQKAFITGFKV
jgi:hypothetical protein